MDVFVMNVDFIFNAIQIYGKLDDEKATNVLVVLRNFRHVMYIKKVNLWDGCPEPYAIKRMIDGYGFHLEEAYAEFRFNDMGPFIELRDACEQRGILRYCTFLSPIERLMMSKNVYGAAWIHVSNATLVTNSMVPTYVCNYCDIRTTNETKYPKKIKISTFDLESVRDQIIQISTINDTLDENLTIVKNARRVIGQTMKSSLPIVVDDNCLPMDDGGEGEGRNASILSYGNTAESRRKMLQDWANIINNFDPDYLIGHNIKNYDIPTLLKNATDCNMLNFFFSRPAHNLQTGENVRPPVTTQEMPPKDGYQQTKVTCTRGIIDSLDVMLKEYDTYKSYKLDFLGKQILGYGKDPIPYGMIEVLYNGTIEDVTKLMRYNIRDCVVSLNILLKLQKFHDMIELARAGKVLLDWVFGRGQECKAQALTVEAFFRNGLIFPAVPRSTEVDQTHVAKEETEGKKSTGTRYGGALVVPTKSGIYFKDPLTTLDFASLYPSIMMAHNLCFSTWVKPEDFEWASKMFDVIMTSHGDYFINFHINEIDRRRAKLKEIEAIGNPEAIETEQTSFDQYMALRRRGVVPVILETLVATRAATKAEMKKHKAGSMMHGILDKRQNALKLICNSIYGAYGSPTFKIPCIAISASVTSYGQDNLKVTENIVKNALPGTEVIAGDTDSLMMIFNMPDLTRDASGVITLESLQRIMDKGLELAGIITKVIDRKPMKIEWEKVLWPAVFPKDVKSDDETKGVKKNYYARKLLRVSDVHVNRDDPKSVKDYDDRLMIKGMSAVRSNFCDYVQEIVSRVCYIIVMEENGGIEKALEYIGGIDRDLRQMAKRQGDRYKKLTLYAKYGNENYKSENAITKLYDLNKKRNGPPIYLGTSMPYYVVCTGDSSDKVSDKAEHSVMVEDMSRDIAIDINHYKKHQLRHALKIAVPFHETEIDDALFPGVRHVRKSKAQKGDMNMFAQKVDSSAAFANFNVPAVIPIKRKKDQEVTKKKSEKRPQEKPVATAPEEPKKKKPTLLDFFIKK